MTAMSNTPTMARRIRVLLIDDNETIHHEIGALLRSWDDIDLLGQGYNGEEAVDLCDQYQPDIVLMDVSMPVMNGIIATRLILARYSHIRIIAMSGIDDSSIVQMMISAGAMGYVLKDAYPDQIANTIRAVHEGKFVVSGRVAKPLLTAAPPADFGLSSRELQVLSLMAKGHTNAQIADELSISQPTVRFHLYNILEKLGVATRSEALVVAARNHLV